MNVVQEKLFDKFQAKAGRERERERLRWPIPIFETLEKEKKFLQTNEDGKGRES